MKATSIKGLPVRPQDGDADTGTVADLLLDSEERRVLAFHVSRLENDTIYVLDVSDVISVSDDGVVAQPDAVFLPEPDAQRYDTLPTLGRMLEEKAMTESGRILGKLSDIDVDTATWKVTGYDVVGNLAEAFQHGEQRIAAEEVISAGAQMLLVEDKEGGR